MKVQLPVSKPAIFVRCYLTRDDPSGAVQGTPAEHAARTLARVGRVLSVEERGPYWKMPELDEVTIDLDVTGEEACERICAALATGGWVSGEDDAVWNRGPNAQALDDRLFWANVMVLTKE